MIDFKLKALTPIGEKPVAELRQGDLVYSTTNRGVVINAIKKKYEGHAETFVRVACNGTSISCSPDQYLARKAGAQSKISYDKVSRIGPGTMIYRSEDGLTSPEEVTVVETRTSEKTPVVGFKLENYPFNYIVDGFVVGSE
jgi:hypothetical protein